VKRLVSDYGENFISGLEDSIRKIEKRLGNEAMKEALQKLQEMDLASVARIVLRYYDKAYDHSIIAKEKELITRISFESDDMKLITERLCAYMREMPQVL
jgi:tRNA 2-selenouridine synthase